MTTFKRVEQLRSGYIGYVDPVSLASSTKLTLNYHDNRFYQTYLVPLEHIPTRRLNPSERQMRKTFIWFKEALQKRFGHQENSGIKLVEFVDGIVDKLLFSVITVKDGLNAFKVFETLNARGVRLSATDLLKNYLFSLIADAKTHDNELRKLEEDWAWITNQVGSDEFPRYLRAFWNSRHPLVRQINLFKTIRNKITDRNEAYALLRELGQSAEIWAGLNDPGDKRWGAKAKTYLKELQLFRVQQPLPLLMSCYEQFFESKQQVFERILRVISVISLRYNVISNRRPGEQETTYNNVAQKVFAGDYSNAPAIIDALQTVYPSDKEFRGAFETKSLSTNSSRNKQIARYLLSSIEKRISGKSPEDTWTLEHILPQNADDTTWQGISPDRLDDLVYRLGNMTLLEKPANQQAGKDSYGIKKDIYSESLCKLTQEIAERYDSWDEDAIERHQRWLAKCAVDIWRID